MKNRRSENHRRQAEVLIRQLDRLRHDQARRKRLGYGTRTPTSSADVRRRDLNTQIIRHLHQARLAYEQENTP